MSIDPAGLRVNAKRINITVPERILDAIDRFSQERGQTRSGFLVEAATEYMGCAGGRSPSGAQTTSQGPSSERQLSSRAFCPGRRWDYNAVASATTLRRLPLHAESTFPRRLWNSAGVAALPTLARKALRRGGRWRSSRHTSASARCPAAGQTAGQETKVIEHHLCCSARVGSGGIGSPRKAACAWRKSQGRLSAARPIITPSTS